MTERAAAPPRRARARPRSGPDRVTVMLASLAVFLIVLSVLAARIRVTAPATTPARRVLVVRRIYRTTIVDDGASASRDAAPTESVSTSAGAGASPAPATRSSPAR